MLARRVGDRLFSRTALPIFAVGAVVLAAGVYGAWRVHRLHKRGSEMLSENVASIRSAEQLEVITREIRHRFKRHLSSGNDRHMDDVMELLPRGFAALEEVNGLATTPHEEQLTLRIGQNYFRLQDIFANLQREPSSIVRREMMLSLADHLIPNRILADTSEYIELNEEALDDNTQRNQATANRLMFGLLLLGTCGGVAGLIAGYGIARLVNRTIVQLAIPIRDTAGKLSQVAGPVTWNAKPGFDDLEAVLKSLSSHVTTVIQRLQDSERDQLRAEQLAAVGQLAAGLAHELRNPLTSMKAILQLAPEPGELTHHDLKVLREETARLEHSVQSLLDFARPPQPQKTQIDLRCLLNQSVSLVERGCQRKGVTLKYTPAEKEITILADAAQIRQLVLNLLLNAIDLTPREGTIFLTSFEASRLSEQLSDVTPTDSAADSQWVVVQVSDTGPGLPPELHNRLFEPFVTTKETGTGLGLSICRHIVRAHGGVISARDRSEGGAVFEVWLPLDSSVDSHAPSKIPFSSASRPEPVTAPEDFNGEVSCQKF